MNKQFLPVTLEECRARGWDAPDFVYVCGGEASPYPREDIMRIGKSKVSEWIENH